VADVQLKGGTAFRYLDVTLAPGESIVTEAGAMASMAAELELESKFNGGFFVGLARAFLGGESLFINTYSPRGGVDLSRVRRVYLLHPRRTIIASLCWLHLVYRS
jgi:uncharacterized protein (AIM24 family)